MTDSVCLVHINPRVCSCPCSVETRTEAEVCIGSRIVSTLLLRSNGDWLSSGHVDLNMIPGPVVWRVCFRSKRVGQSKKLLSAERQRKEHVKAKDSDVGDAVCGRRMR
jgi:hypothetical protein